MRIGPWRNNFSNRRLAAASRQKLITFLERTIVLYSKDIDVLKISALLPRTNHVGVRAYVGAFRMNVYITFKGNVAIANRINDEWRNRLYRLHKVTRECPPVVFVLCT